MGSELSPPYQFLNIQLSVTAEAEPPADSTTPASACGSAASAVKFALPEGSSARLEGSFSSMEYNFKNKVYSGNCLEPT